MIVLLQTRHDYRKEEKMRYLFLLVFYTILFALSANAQIEKTPFLKRYACGVTLTAARGEYAFERVGSADLCLAVKLVKQITGKDSKGTAIYLAGFKSAGWKRMPKLASLYARKHYTVALFNQLATAGFNPEENVIQINPVLFGSTYASVGRNKKQIDFLRNYEQWNGMIAIAHELLHNALRHSGVSVGDQHCVMVYPPHAYLVGLYRSLGAKYGVPQGISDIQSSSEVSAYRGQCKAWLKKHSLT